MGIALVTGSAGLIGSEACRRFHVEGMDVVGIDNDMRKYFFGSAASTQSSLSRLQNELPRYRHVNADIRSQGTIDQIFRDRKNDIELIVHTAAQPSHDWAAREPATDFTVNAVGTLNLLEATRQHCPDAAFVFTSTNKVYGDNPNRLPLVELETRWEIAEDHPFQAGIDESMSVDQCTHSIFGVSKTAADLMVQEYGRYFGINTASLRCGCLTGPAHAGAELHGFLAYLMQCTTSGTPYRIFGYQGKQVRDNIHSHDLVSAIWHIFQNPRAGSVYNMGGSRHSNCSMLEAIALCEQIAGRELSHSYEDDNRVGDHIWWISDVSRFQADYPDWSYRYDLEAILREIHAAQTA